VAKAASLFYSFPSQLKLTAIDAKNHCPKGIRLILESSSSLVIFVFATKAQKN
jgi:hypothetical protein